MLALASVIAASLSPVPHDAAQIDLTAGQPAPRSIVEIARAAWPESPCASTASVRLVDEPLPPTDTFWALGAAPLGPNLPPQMCVALVRRTLSLRRACDVAVHELGHLAGYVHPDEAGPQPDDARAPMMAHNPGSWPACDALDEKPLTRATAIRAVRRVAPRRTIACVTIKDGWYYLCRARHPSRRTIRYTVEVTDEGPRAVKLARGERP